MARPVKIEYPGAFYHVTARGNERKRIFSLFSRPAATARCRKPWLQRWTKTGGLGPGTGEFIQGLIGEGRSPFPLKV